MNDYSFRLRFKFYDGTKLGVEDGQLRLDCPEANRSLTLKSLIPEQSIKDSSEVALIGESWPSEREAHQAGERYTEALLLSMARMQIGVDLGARSPQAVVTRSGLQWMGEKVGERVLQDSAGLMVFESTPVPKFVSVGTMSVQLIRPAKRFESCFQAAIDHDLSPRERLSVELFNASFFESSIDARFLTLMIAVEALLQPATREQHSKDHVDRLIALTRDALGIDDDEKESLLGSLRFLRKDSISRTGRNLANAMLAGRQYMELPPDEFFKHCYKLRSSLVHGSAPRREDIANAVSRLADFVSDLLAGPLLEIE